MRPRAQVRLSPEDVGRRVSVRFRLDPSERGEAGGPTLTDAVGELLSWERGQLRIAKRDGEVVTVGQERLVAGRTVPDPPRRGPRPPR